MFYKVDKNIVDEEVFDFYYNQIKKEIEDELKILKKQIGLKNVKRFKENVTNEINKEQEMGLMYTFGNAKLPKTTMIINLGSWFNCSGRKEGFCEICEKCYDKQPEVRFPKRFAGRFRQEIFWRTADAHIIARIIINILNKNKQINLIRWSEVGELRNQDDLNKLIRISNIIGSLTGVKSYIYTHNRFLDFTDNKERPYLIINGSGFMVDNEYRVVEKDKIEEEFNNLSDLSNKKECICDCETCTHYCSENGNWIIIEELR